MATLSGQDGIADGSLLFSRSPITLSVTESLATLPFGTLGTFELFLWTGAKASKPASPQYTLSTYGATAAQFIRPTWTINVGEYVKDFIIREVGYNTTPSGASPAIWMAYEFTDNAIVSPSTYTSPTAAAFLGYVPHFEGWTGSNRYLTDFLQSHPDEIYFDDHLDVSLRASRLGYTGGTEINLANYTFTNQRTLNVYTTTSTVSTTSTSLTKNNSWGLTLMNSLSVPSSERYDTFEFKAVFNLNSGGTSDSPTRLITMTRPCRQPNGKLSFINKRGVLQDIVLRGRIDKEKAFSSQTYKSGNIYDNWTAGYSPTQHMDLTYSVNGNYLFTVNTGFIGSSYNDAIEEMLASERVWLTDSDDTVYPVRIQDVQDKEYNGYYDKQVNKTFRLIAAAPIVNNIGI